MLTGLALWHLVSHVIPVYAIVLLGYACVRIGLLKPLHLPGVSRYVFMVGIPIYAFSVMASDDPYGTSFRLVGADVLQKVIALTLGCLWWRLSPTGSIDNLIDFYMLATLPNTVLVANPLLQPLYGDEVLGEVVTIILLQCSIWYNLTIALYELRGVLLEENAEQKIQVKEGAELFESSQLKSEQSFLQSSTISIIVGCGCHHDSSKCSNDWRRHFEAFPHARNAIIRTSSAPPLFSALGKVFPAPAQEAAAGVKGDEVSSAGVVPQSSGGFFSPNTLSAADMNMASARNLLFNSYRAENMASATELAALSRSRKDLPTSVHAFAATDARAEQASSKRRSGNGLFFAGKYVVKAFNRLKYVPLTYASVTGFGYSLVAYKCNWTMPYSVQTSIKLISNGAVGLALFVLGTTWASSGTLILCGWKNMLWGMLVRFIVSPFIMIATGLIVGLEGDAYRFAVLQAVIPQGLVCFVFAKEYGLHPEEFATAVITHLLVFVPVAVAYYMVLDSI